MKVRLSSFAVAITATALLPLAACSSDSGAGADMTSAGAVGSTGASSSAGSNGAGSGGGSNAGSDGGSIGGGGQTSGGLTTGGSGNGSAGTVGATSSGSSASNGGGNTTSATGQSGGNGTTGGATGGSDGADSGSTIPATFDTVRLVLGGGGPITPCASAPCHAAGGMAPPGNSLTLADNAQLYTNLTTHMSKDCGNIPVVNPGKPDQSAILKVLKTGCGTTIGRMPKGCTDQDGNCIPPEYVQAISTWIANGAPKQ